jgi:hypothetical protein
LTNHKIPASTAARTNIPAIIPSFFDDNQLCGDTTTGRSAAALAVEDNIDADAADDDEDDNDADGFWDAAEPGTDVAPAPWVVWGLLSRTAEADPESAA